MEIALIADSRRGVGLGHAARQIALAEEINAAGEEVCLHLTSPVLSLEEDVDLLERAGVEVVYIDSLFSFPSRNFSARVFDVARYSNDVVSDMCSGGTFLNVCFDDFGDTANGPPKTIVPNYGPIRLRGSNRKSESVVVGPQYVPLRTTIFKNKWLANEFSRENSLSKVLVSLGGNPNLEVLRTVSTAVSTSADCRFEIARGENQVGDLFDEEVRRCFEANGLEVSLLEGGEFAGALLRCDACILSPGVSVWEARALRKPCAVVDASDTVLQLFRGEDAGLRPLSVSDRDFEENIVSWLKAVCDSGSESFMDADVDFSGGFRVLKKLEEWIGRK